MLIARIIVYLSALLWLAVPIRQWKEKYFLYFFILSLTDPLVMLLRIYFSSVYPFQIYMISTMLLVVSLLNINSKKLFLWGGAILTGTALAVFVNVFKLAIPLTIVHTLILLILVRKVTIRIIENSGIKIFHCLFLMYQMTLTLKFFMVITNTRTGVLYFYVTSFFEILIALYFSLSKEGSSRIILRFEQNLA
ncbi:MAG: hypothetical protein Q8933_07430 [Bacteroidota bacterium]|nr:hypothetical protein [Bacteroidota bacterium]MDP4192050.1 hypothetical protein [Bacteroidota bacterium]MDP4194471.1 hypothetical protein [Bacteroidota bacterium]